MSNYRLTVEYMDDTHIVHKVRFTVSAITVQEAFIKAQEEIERLYSIIEKEYILKSIKEE